MTPVLQSFKRIWLCSLRRMRPFVENRIHFYLTPHRVEILRKVFAHLDVAVDGQRNPRGGVLQAQIVRDFAVDKSSISRMLSKMERDGFIRRTRWHMNIMFKVVHLTDLGFEMMDVIRSLRASEGAPDAQILEAFLGESPDDPIAFADNDTVQGEHVTSSTWRRGHAAAKTTQAPASVARDALAVQQEALDPGRVTHDESATARGALDVETLSTEPIAPREQSVPKVGADVPLNAPHDATSTEVGTDHSWVGADMPPAAETARIAIANRSATLAPKANDAARSEGAMHHEEIRGEGVAIASVLRRDQIDALYRQCNAIRVALGDDALHLHPWQLCEGAEKFFDPELGISYWRHCRLRNGDVDDRILDEIPDDYLDVAGPFRPGNDVDPPGTKWRRPRVA